MNTPGDQQSIGGDTRRNDAFEKVSGETRYVEDISMPSLLHAKVLRSPHHHARLLSLNTSTASLVPGVVRIITAEDIPGVNGFPEYSHDEPLLTRVGETLKTKGAPIALVVADTVVAAMSGLDAIKVEYELLPHNFKADLNGTPIYKNGNRLKEPGGKCDDCGFDKE